MYSIDSMNCLSVLLLLLSISLSYQQDPSITTTTTSPTTTTTIACSEASWLEWSSWSTCSDSCGSCGITTRTRVCLSTSTACTCIGDGLSVEYCNLSVCRYPRSACCNNLRVTTLNGYFGCAINSTTVSASFY